jgi:hypothetical protein
MNPSLKRLHNTQRLLRWFSLVRLDSNNILRLAVAIRLSFSEYATESTQLQQLL